MTFYKFGYLNYKYNVMILPYLKQCYVHVHVYTYTYVSSYYIRILFVTE